MVATLQRREELDSSLLLIAHLICADGQIHVQEAEALQSLSEDIGTNQATQKALDAILGKLSEAPSVGKLAKKVLPGQQVEVIQQLLAIACIDGYLAPVEKNFIRGIAKLWNISGEDFERLKLSAQQAQRLSARTEANGISDELSKAAQILKGAESVLSKALVERLADIAPQSLGRRVRKPSKKFY